MYEYIHVHVYLHTVEPPNNSDMYFETQYTCNIIVAVSSPYHNTHAHVHIIRMNMNKHPLCIMNTAILYFTVSNAIPMFSV